ncbi:hypothetical protein [Desulfopila sp. IMCC35008]|uniref:hypothetical protein n=1 Tax=Desulfopila sp. IMCC35008 TaxID=2653858 RepID=UPI0013D8DB1F|nr:hypothetical protein [Desulfopila sp. IMCC35008]
MTENQSTPYMLLGAVTALLCSPVPIIAAFTSNISGDTRIGLFCLTASLLFFGIGEVLNHPAHAGNRYMKDGAPGRFNRFSQRKRIPCGLGNLLFIISLLLLFIGMAKIFTD